MDVNYRCSIIACVLLCPVARVLARLYLLDGTERMQLHIDTKAAQPEICCKITVIRCVCEYCDHASV